MKKSILLILLPFLFTACGTMQTVSIKEPVVKILTELEEKQDELYVKANDWMISMFVDASSVIQFSDKEEGVLIGKYLLSGQASTTMTLFGNTTTDTRVYAKIDIRVRDGRARISIEPLDSWQYDSSGLTIRNYSEENFYQDADNVLVSFENAILASKIEF